MEKGKTVSLILTCYNCKNNLIRTLKSIEMQEYPNIEVIIIDGMSTDGTVDVIKAYEKNTKYTCRWISEKDKGIYDAMNKGLALAGGEVIAFFNDLFLIPNAVTLMVDAIERENTDGAHADLIYATDDKVKRYWKMGDGEISNGWMPGHPCLYLKREVYEKYGNYNSDYKCSADYEFMIRILKDDCIKLAYVPVTIVQMYYGGTSTGGIRSYILSLKEAHQALKSNGIKFAWWVDLVRTLRVLNQFLETKKYIQNCNKGVAQMTDKTDNLSRAEQSRAELIILYIEKNANYRQHKLSVIGVF